MEAKAAFSDQAQPNCLRSDQPDTAAGHLPAVEADTVTIQGRLALVDRSVHVAVLMRRAGERLSCTTHH